MHLKPPHDLRLVKRRQKMIVLVARPAELGADFELILLPALLSVALLSSEYPLSSEIVSGSSDELILPRVTRTGLASLSSWWSASIPSTARGILLSAQAYLWFVITWLTQILLIHKSLLCKLVCGSKSFCGLWFLFWRIKLGLGSATKYPGVTPGW